MQEEPGSRHGDVDSDGDHDMAAPVRSADPLDGDALSDGGAGAFRRVSSSDSDLEADHEGTPSCA